MMFFDSYLHEHDWFQFRDFGDNQRILSLNGESYPNHIISTEDEKSIRGRLYTISRGNAVLNSKNDKNRIDKIKGLGVEYDFSRLSIYAYGLRRR